MTDHHHSNGDSGTDTVRVFVNYRRGDTRHVAGRLRDLIVARFGDGSVFVDVESIEPGLDYVSAIDTAVASCDAMLVLIGDKWLEAHDEHGNRRIDDPTDRLRIEIEAGLRNQTCVIPVLVDSASMPKSKDLPMSLVPLSRHQATRLNHESFRVDAYRILGVVERIGGPRPPPAVPKERRAARWLTFGLLLTDLLLLLGLNASARASVRASRPDLPLGGTWATVWWLLPLLPIIVAMWLVVIDKRQGIALGCVAGAAVWLGISLIFAQVRSAPSTSVYLFVLAPLGASIVTLFVAAPEMRERVRRNDWDRALFAGALVVAAIVLRTDSGPIARLLTSATERKHWAEISPMFWIAFLVPVLIGFPGAFLRCNKIQTQALLTFALLQVMYPLVLTLMSFGSRNYLQHVTDVVFLVGSFCMLASVSVGQRGTAASFLNK